MCPGFRGVEWVEVHAAAFEEGSMGRRGYPAEFRRKVLDLVDVGRKVADVARDLGVSDQTIYNWRLQDRIDRGLEPGATSAGRPTTSASSRTTTSWRRTRRRVRCSSWSRSRSTTSTRRTPRCTPPVTATPRTTSRRTPPNGSRPTATRSTAGSMRRARADGAPRHRPTMGGRPEGDRRSDVAQSRRRHTDRTRSTTR